MSTTRDPAASEARPSIGEVVIADRTETWRSLGFEVGDHDDGGAFTVGAVSVRLVDPGGGRGIVGWSLRDARTANLDGLPTRLDRSRPPVAQAHPNGALAIDHVVALTPSLDRTAAALDDAGVSLRRIREVGAPQAGARQGFFRLGEVVLEVVQQAMAPETGAGKRDSPPPGASHPASFWGLVFVVSDLDRLAALLGDRLGRPRDAVQPARRIATVRRSAGASVPVAFITPEARRRPS